MRDSTTNPAPGVSLYTGPVAEDLAHIPADLKARDQWVLWRGADLIDQQTGEVRLDKIPINPQTLRNADVTDPATWGTFEQCLAALPVALEGWHEEDPGAYRGGGVGFVFTAEDPYAGVDLDHCRISDTGEIADWAQKIIRELDSYSEVSPSGTGVHVLMQGTLPPRRRKKGSVEMYNNYRFFTVTGWHLPGTPATIQARQEALTALHSAVFGPQQYREKNGPDPHATSTPPLDDAGLLDKASKARNGVKFKALWAGDTSAYNADDSAADMALCSLLAFWTQDPAQIDRLFRQSGLMREKWDEQRGAQSYGVRTIAEALARQTKHYAPRKRQAHQRHNGQLPPGNQGTEATRPTVLPVGDPAAVLDTVSPCTHVANATRIAREYTDRLHYVLGRGWILWTGQFWRTDPTPDGALATGFVSGLARAIAREAATLLEQAAQELDSDRRVSRMKLADARLKWAVQSENERVISAGLKLAKRALLIEHRDIDKDPWLFNCQNVTLDLRTGKTRNHHPDDLITHIAPVTFDPVAICPTWQRFLSEVFAGDMKMVRFIQRAIGWSLTGVVQERALFFLYGPTGHNGKTTLVETIRDLLGDCGEASFGYARKVDVSTFMKSKNQDDNQHKAAMLAGPRFVYSSEVDSEHRLNEQLLKDITGGDTLEGRHLYREAFTFRPTFKPWMYGNYKPEIRGTDDALWSRVKLVEFEVSFADRVDLKLPDKLRAELPGILNWAIQGCLNWQQEGLNPPEKVKIATQNYRLEQDRVAQFIHECCVTLPAASIKAKRLYTAYRTWCAENEYEALNQHRWGAYLTAHDYPSDDNSTGRGAVRRGIDLQEPPEEDDHSATQRVAPPRQRVAKGSSAEGQQRRGENDATTKSATLSTLTSEVSPQEHYLRESWEFRVERVAVEEGNTNDSQQRRGKTDAILVTEKGSTSPSGADEFDEGIVV